MGELQKGILLAKDLPDPEFTALWDRIILPAGLKDQIVLQIVLELTVRKRLPAGAVPLHGIILLAGPPGTGKTSLAKAAASKAATMLPGAKLRFVQVEPHALTSAQLGKSQQAVHELLRGPIKEYAHQGPTVVLLDEVETLAANRTKLSLEANPIDVHRATDALLAGLDLLATEYPNLLFIATTNFEKAVDPALFSRADFVLRTPMPDKQACQAILRDTIEAMSKEWSGLKTLLKDGRLPALAAAAAGMDGRRIRKAVLSACALSKETTLNPGKLDAETLRKHLLKSKEAPA